MLSFIIRRAKNFQGHDTTAASLQWTVHLLGHHPDIQTRLQEEVDGFFGENHRKINVRIKIRILETKSKKHGRFQETKLL